MTSWNLPRAHSERARLVLTFLLKDTAGNWRCRFCDATAARRPLRIARFEPWYGQWRRRSMWRTMHLLYVNKPVLDA
jgi:hypothetical protein